MNFKFNIEYLVKVESCKIAQCPGWEQQNIKCLTRRLN